MTNVIFVSFRMYHIEEYAGGKCSSCCCDELRQRKVNMKKYTSDDFTFVVCAYKESPYLEDCIMSLLKQTVKAHILIATSTPNDHITGMAEKYGIPCYINSGKAGIAEDWNFGCGQAKTKVVAIAHQDDIYLPEYAKTVLEQLNKAKHPLIAFTDYGEIREDKVVTDNRLLNIKRVMLFPFRSRGLQNSIFVRRRILSFGSPICCPSVTFVKENLPFPFFTPGYRSNVDWQAWERFSRLQGTFVYCNSILMHHRIHSESATTQIIADHDRGKEDFDMFCRFWPRPVARCIEYLYCKCEDSNALE